MQSHSNFLERITSQSLEQYHAVYFNLATDQVYSFSNLQLYNSDATDFTIFGVVVCYTLWLTWNKILFDGIQLDLITF